MKILILSAQHKQRTSKSSILRVYEDLSRAGADVFYYCVSNNIFHRLFGADRLLLQAEPKAIYSWSFWYYPGLLKTLDRTFSELWIKQHVENLLVEVNNSDDPHIIVEAGAASVVVLALLKPLMEAGVNLSIHYRINDPLDAFRRSAPSVHRAHNILVQRNIPGADIEISTPCSVEWARHIPPGIPDKIMELKSRKKNISKPYILYAGVYPIEEVMLREILRHHDDVNVKYTGKVDHHVQGAEFLGIISSRELDDLWAGADAGIMVFPDQRFEWWFWSNKMMVMRFLQIPIYGFLKGNSKEVFQLFPRQSEYFKEHGLVQLGVDEAPITLASDYMQSWNDFTKKMLRN